MQNSISESNFPLPVGYSFVCSAEKEIPSPRHLDVTHRRHIRQRPSGDGFRPDIAMGPYEPCHHQSSIFKNLCGLHHISF